MHARPVDRGRAQTLIDGLWRIAPRQRDSEGTARGDRLGRRGSDEIHSAGDQRELVGEDGRLGDGAVRGVMTKVSGISEVPRSLHASARKRRHRRIITSRRPPSVR